MRCRVLASLERAPRLRSGIRASAVIAPSPPLPKSVTGPPMRSLTDIFEEYDFLDGDDRYRLLIELGRALEPMPGALKTDATLVRGCSASVWVYPVPREDGRLHFLADSNAAITKGIVALVLSAVQDKPASEVAAMDIAAALAPFDLTRQLSSNRTQGVPNMIALRSEEHTSELQSLMRISSAVFCLKKKKTNEHIMS